jgi:hypothetical protein
VFCLARPAKEGEHVLPKSWYPSTTPETVQRVIVPVCTVCADEFEKAERAFAHPLLMAIEPTSPEVVGVSQAFQRSWQFDRAPTDREARHRAGRLRKLAREMKFVPTPTDGRVYPQVPGRTPDGKEISVSPAFEIPGSVRQRIAEKFARGFHFAECREPLPLAADITFFWGGQLHAVLQAGLAKMPINDRLAPGLYYRVMRDGEWALWSFLLWGHFHFGAIVRLPVS